MEGLAHAPRVLVLEMDTRDYRAIPRMQVITSLTQVVQIDMARILDHVATYTSH